jgi:hypothetical protein
VRAEIRVKGTWLKDPQGCIIRVVKDNENAAISCG